MILFIMSFLICSTIISMRIVQCNLEPISFCFVPVPTCMPSYLMPKSVFVKANTAFEKSTIIAYNEDYFVLRNRTRTPEVPYGECFCTWTQLVVMRDGRNSCRMVCSSEAEFVNGRRPIVARQIESGIRRGTTEYFLLFGQTVCRHA